MKQHILALFNPKVESDSDLFDKTKYLLSYRILLFLSIAVGILSVIYTFTNSIAFSIPTYIGFLMILLTFYYVKKSKNYKSVMILFNIFGWIICSSTLFFINNQSIISNSLWMVVSTNFAFLTSGRKIGALITGLNGISLALFFYLFPSLKYEIPGELTQLELIGLCLNIFICFILFFYFNWQSITTNKKAEAQIKEANKSLQNQLDIINSQNDEKTILLKEIHHRVKNNLQVIISLLRLQKSNIENQEEISKFNESIGRIMAMSLIHEKIYQTEDFSKINFSAYLDNLAKDIISSFETNKKIEFNLNSTVDQIKLKAVVPLALIFNELLTNSMKYAFQNTDYPKIDIELKLINLNELTVSYSDNGKWIENTKSNSFGLELIEALSEQLNGTYKMDSSGGTKYIFHFENMNA